MFTRTDGFRGRLRRFELERFLEPPLDPVPERGFQSRIAQLGHLGSERGAHFESFAPTAALARAAWAERFVCWCFPALRALLRGRSPRENRFQPSPATCDSPVEASLLARKRGGKLARPWRRYRPRKNAVRRALRCELEKQLELVASTPALLSSAVIGARRRMRTFGISRKLAMRLLLPSKRTPQHG